MKKHLFENFNWSLWWTTLALSVVGLVNLYSAVSLWGEESRIQLFWNQFLWFFIGFLLLFLFMIVDYQIWEKFGGAFYAFVLLMLLLVLLVGRTVSGHKSWLGLGSVSFQPSELAKIAIIFVVARYFSDNPNPWGHHLFGLLKPMFFVAIPFGLVLLQKDLGTTLFYPLLFLTMALVAKVERRTIFLVLFCVLTGGVLTYQYGLKPYQKERIHIFLNPESDPKNSGYHLLQSKIAVGSGRFFGKGYMKGQMNKLRYLPDKHTDFIFPVLAEEWGFLGSSLCLGLYAFLLWSGMNIARRAREPFGAYLAVGVCSLFFWHLLINLGGVLGMIPLTGVPLPFLSYGGSSTVTFFISVGLLMNIHMRRFMF